MIVVRDSTIESSMHPAGCVCSTEGLQCSKYIPDNAVDVFTCFQLGARCFVRPPHNAFLLRRCPAPIRTPHPPRLIAIYLVHSKSKETLKVKPRGLRVISYILLYKRQGIQSASLLRHSHSRSRNKETPKAKQRVLLQGCTW